MNSRLLTTDVSVKRRRTRRVRSRATSRSATGLQAWFLNARHAWITDGHGWNAALCDRGVRCRLCGPKVRLR